MSDWSQPQTDVSDEALVERVKQQDVAAFTQLYERYAHSVYAVAAHLLTPRDAEEVVQEVFLRLWHRAAQFDPARGSFRAWFMTIARHRILDELKHHGLNQRTRRASEINQLLTDAALPESDVAEAVWLRQRQDALLQALQQLPDEQRWVLILSYFGGLSHSEIAAQLEWPLGTVKKRIGLGLQKLRHCLMNWREVS